ncbi:CRISPR-associated endonuclease Cas3'' [Nitrospirillum amazonense]|nr:CRISPR-associated endonuclease Cas3'' [Nitrospirillum amazonense]
MVLPFLTAYWGKAQPRPDAVQSWHPVAYHSLDVAAAMAALLDVRPAWLAAVAAALNLSPEACRQRLVLAAALHDLGKFAENFQCKVPALQQLLSAEAGRTPHARLSTSGHGDIGHSLWKALARERRLRGLTPWVQAAVAHHGAPTTDPALNNAMTEASITDAGAFTDAALDLIGRPAFPDNYPEELGAETWRVTGLVILADWIGSNQSWGTPVTRLTQEIGTMEKSGSPSSLLSCRILGWWSWSGSSRGTRLINTLTARGNRRRSPSSKRPE